MMRGSAALCAVAVVTLLVAVRPANADTYTVNSTADDVDAAPGNGVCATSSGTCTLRAAVQEANLHAGPDIVTLPAGIFVLALPGPGEDAAATGDLDVLQPLDINGAGRESTIIDGLKSDRILHSLTTALAVRDLTLRHGAAAPNPGGALLAQTGTLAIERVRFEGNSATDGGALLALDSLTISDSVFDRNSASGNGGGVIQTGSGTLTLTGTTFTSNVSVVTGGALVTVATGAVTVTNCMFSSNLASNFGGLFVGATSAFSMSGTTFDRNRAVTTAGGFGYSGPGTVSITDTKALGNFAPNGGGGYITAPTGPVHVSGSEFSDNSTLSGAGGGLLVTTTDATIQNVQFRRNASFTGAGGGLAVSATSIDLADVEASENSAASGGGLYLAGTNVALTRVRAVNNGGTIASGGVFVGATSASITDSTIEGNVGGQGGGLIVSGGSLVMTNSTLSNNRSVGPVALGGGSFISVASPSTLTNVTFSGNVADIQGGGLQMIGDLTLRNVTFADNTAPMGSAIFNGGTLTLGSSIIAGSAASHCAGAAITSGDFNIDSNGTCGLAGGNDRNNVDPQLGSLADNGGPTFTHLPASTSPAIDGGNPVGCPATDQRGETRPTDGNGDGSSVCDVGAVEFLDLCPTDPAKTLPGICGCGVADTDAALPNGVADCLINGELKARLARAKTIIAGLTGDPSETAVESELVDIANGLGTYVKQFKTQLVLADPKAKLDKLAKKTKKPVKKVTKAKAGKKLAKAKTKATMALDNLDRAVAPQ